MVVEAPRNIEVLIKKAAVDPAFKEILFEKRAGAAEVIALKLSPAEAAMLDAVPEEQLRAIIGRTKVNPKLRPAFLGATAAAILAALATAGCKGRAANDTPDPVPTTGINPDYPPQVETAETAATGGSGTLAPGVAEGIYAGGNKTVTGGGAGGGLGGIRPDGTLTKRQGETEVSVVDVVVVPPAVGLPARETDDVKKTIKNHIPDILSLYAAALEKGTAPEDGKLVIGFNIKADGSVYDVAVISSTIRSSAFSEAVVTEVETWRFGAIEERGVSAAATFIFRSGDD